MLELSSLIFLVKHSINLRNDITASYQPRRLPYNLQQPIKDEIDKLTQNDFVEKSESMEAFPIMPVMERNSKTKIAVDFKSFTTKLFLSNLTSRRFI